MSARKAALTLKKRLRSSLTVPRNMAAPKPTPAMMPAMIGTGIDVTSYAAPNPTTKIAASKPSRRTDVKEREKKPYSRRLSKFAWTSSSMFRSHLVCHDPLLFIPGARCVTKKYVMMMDAKPSMPPSTMKAVVVVIVSFCV